MSDHQDNRPARLQRGAFVLAANAMSPAYFARLADLLRRLNERGDGTDQEAAR